MRAIVMNGYGGPEVLEPADLPSPGPAPGEALVRIRAVAVNPADPKWRAGMFAGFVPVTFPHVLGYDIAGEVIGGEGWPIGARVFAMLDPVTKGGYAGQIAIPAARLAAIPAGIDDPAAAAIPTAGLTGLQLVETALDVRAGQRILVTGAVGAVGRVAVHFATERGAIVIAAVRGAQCGAARALGADEAVALDGDGESRAFDHLIDTVGGDEVGRLCRSLAPGGRIVTVATTPIPADGLPTQPEFYAVQPDAAQLARLATAVASGAIAMPVARLLPLAEAAEAHRIVERGGAGGKIILSPDPPAQPQVTTSMMPRLSLSRRAVTGGIADRPRVRDGEGEHGMAGIRFDGRVAIITGAGNGLGRDYALELARRGAKIVVNDLGGSGAGEGASHSAADRVVQQIRDEGGEAIASHDSVATRAGGEAIVRAGVEAFGRIDICINNAGFLRNARFEDLTDAQIDAIIDVHLKGAFYVAQPAYRAMRQNGYGRFLFTGSASAMFGHAWQANYAAAKGGLMGLSHIVAIEGSAYGITSNLLLPTAQSRLADEMDAGFMEIPGFAAAVTGADYAASAERITVPFNTPLAVYLVSERCTATHGIYSANSGRYAKVRILAADGWVAPGGATPPSTDDIGAHFDAICDGSVSHEPLTVYDEFSAVAKAARTQSVI